MTVTTIVIHYCIYCHFYCIRRYYYFSTNFWIYRWPWCKYAYRHRIYFLYTRSRWINIESTTYYKHNLCKFCNQSGNIECFPLICESNSSSEIVTKSQSVHLKCLRCFFMSISSATGTLHTPHNNIPRRAGGVDTLVFWVLLWVLSTIDLSP